MSRRLAVVVALVVACSVLAPAAFATGASATEHEIDSCTVLEEPGEYEIVSDIEGDDADACIEIRADDVTIEGNGHVLDGPGAETDAQGIDLSSGDPSDDVVVSNVELTGWGTGIYAGGNYELSNAVLHDNDNALLHDHGGATQLTDVTIENNDVGIQAIVGGATGTNVTIQENRRGVYGEDGGTFAFDDSRVADNEDDGLLIGHHTDLELTDSTVSGNGGSGIAKIHSIGEARLHVENSTVANNGGDGIIVIGPNTVQLTDVTVTGNDGLEVNANEDGFSPPISASNLHVGPSATVSFENETVALEPVDAEVLPARDGGTAVGDGLNVSGNVTGPMDLRLDVDTGDETADLWRHAGDDWETIEADLAVSDGAIETSVDDEGLYAPGTDVDDDDDGQDGDAGDGDEQDDGSGDGDDDADSDPSDQDGEKDKHTPTPTPSDQDGDKKDKDEDNDADETDGDGAETPTGGGSESSCGCPSGTDTPDGEGPADESTPTSTPANDSTPAGDEQDAQADEEQQQRDDETESGDTGGDGSGDDDSTLAEAPGFGGVVALVALLASALLLRRRR